MPLTNDRNTPERNGSLVNLPVEAGTVIYAGAIVAVNAAGNAVPAADAAGLTVIGRAEAQADNSAGAAGAISITVRRGVFRYANSGASPLTAADVGQVAHVADDATVAKTTTNSIVAGKVLGVEPGGVWVEIR